MGADWSAIGGALGSLGGGYFEYQGAKKTNEANWNIAQYQSQQNQANAREQMEFQERMANTAHVRETRDLVAAGLNPILSSNAGAAAPAGAQGAAGGATMENPLKGVGGRAGELAQNLLNLKRGAEEIKLLQKQQANTDANTAKALADKDKAIVDAKVNSKGIPQADAVNKLWQKGSHLYDKAIDALFPTTPKSRADEAAKRMKKRYENKGATVNPRY